MAAQQAIMETWQGAKTLAEKLVLAGGTLGIASFFLPWMSVSFFFVNGTGSGWTLARSGYTSLWFYPLMMAICLFLAWLNLHSGSRKRILVARWYIAIGSAWTWHLLSNTFATNGSLLAGGWLAVAASVLMLAGGILQTGDQLSSNAWREGQ